MVTARVDWTSGSPTTEFITYVDLISQDTSAKTSTVHSFIKAVNRGNTSSFSGTSGTQKATIGGKAAGSHTSTLPSGVSTDATRWNDGPFSVTVDHDSSGHRNRDTVVQTISGWFSNTSSGLGPTYPDIAGDPGIVPLAIISNITPTSIQLDWGDPLDTGGSPIASFTIIRYKNVIVLGSEDHIQFTNVGDLDTGPLGYKLVVTGLSPSTLYYWAITATNTSGNTTQVGSNTNSASTNTPVHVKIGAVYKYAGVYIKVAGAYRLVIPYSKLTGLYKPLK